MLTYVNTEQAPKGRFQQIFQKLFQNMFQQSFQKNIINWSVVVNHKNKPSPIFLGTMVNLPGLSGGERTPPGMSPHTP